MNRSFWLGFHIKNFLFEGYDLTSIWGLVATCVGASSLAILYERGRIYKLHCKSRAFPETEEITDSATDTTTLMTSCSDTTSRRIPAVERFFHAAKYSIFCMQNELIGYLLMLSVMTFNLPIALATWFGAGLGYFVFAANFTITPSAGLKRQGSIGRSERSVSPSLPPPDCGLTVEELTENNAGDTEEDRTDVSQLPLKRQNQGLMGEHNHFPEHDENLGDIVTATVIVHREPSS